MDTGPTHAFMEDAEVVGQQRWPGNYHCLTLRSRLIAPSVQPGQFVHVRLPAPADAILRRPFSVFDTGPSHLSLLYKPVGRGTRAMTDLAPGARVSVIGPLGRGYPMPANNSFPVLVAGGYGMAALYLLARAISRPGTAFFGGASAEDVLCVPQFEALGWRVVAATEDGSLGVRGLVTRPLDDFLSSADRPERLEIFACGPNAMLKAVAERARAIGCRAWVSLDRNMGCGVGACLTCVVRVRSPGGGVEWVRTCKEGPVFEAGDVIWEELDEAL